MTYESQAKDYRKKLGAMDAQIGELEGELASLRARMNSREDEGDKQRALIAKYQDQIRAMRMVSWRDRERESEMKRENERERERER